MRVAYVLLCYHSLWYAMLCCSAASSGSGVVPQWLSAGPLSVCLSVRFPCPVLLVLRALYRFGREGREVWAVTFSCGSIESRGVLVEGEENLATCRKDP